MSHPTLIVVVALLGAPPSVDGGTPAPAEPAPAVAPVPAVQRIAKAQQAFQAAKDDAARATAALELQHAADAWAGLLSQNKVLREKRTATGYVAAFNSQGYGITLLYCERTAFFRTGGEGFTTYLKLSPKGEHRAEAERFLSMSPQFCPEPSKH